MKLDKLLTMIFYILLLVTVIIDSLYRDGIKFWRIILIFVTIFVVRIIFNKTFLKKFLSAYIITIIFIFISMYLANVWDFYAIDNYDKFLHFISGILIGFLGLVIYIYLSNGNINNEMKPITIFIFPLIFSIAIAGVWEIWEFSTDQVFGLTAQWDLEDTMWDIILGSLGGGISSGLIYYSNKSKKIRVIQRLINKNNL